ncbi:MAG TPA: TldD/PmbA family protein [Myxococcales bacterium]|nr:TldD/PmbA family protein [Myxococcales bacterium]
MEAQVATRKAGAQRELPLLEVCEQLVSLAKRAGASDAEAYAERTRESSVKVRDGNVEELHQATSKGVGLRVFSAGRLGFAYGTDFSREGLRKLAQDALALAKGAAKDEFNELPRGKSLGRGPEGAYDPAIEEIDPAWKLRVARAAEQAATRVDPRVRKFDSTGAGDYLAHSAIASSKGAAGESRASYVYLYCSPVAEADGQLQTASWSDTRRRLAELQAAEEIGRIAAQRAARMLGARKVKTQKAAIIFEPQQAAGFFGGLAGAVNGDLVHKKSSFLARLLGKRIASEQVTLADDATLAAGLATRPFDGEGVASQRTLVIDRGVLKNFLYDTYTARKAGARSTGNAARSWASLPHIGTSNFILERGTVAPEEIVRTTKRGLLVTAMLGSGANVVTGEYSRGANGLWIEDGQIVHPVQEVTVSGSLLDLLSSIDAVGTDLELRSSIAAPTLRIAEAMISGS